MWMFVRRMHCKAVEILGDAPRPVGKPMLWVSDINARMHAHLHTHTLHAGGKHYFGMLLRRCVMPLVVFPRQPLVFTFPTWTSRPSYYSPGGHQGTCSSEKSFSIVLSSSEPIKSSGGGKARTSCPHQDGGLRTSSPLCSMISVHVFMFDDNIRLSLRRSAMYALSTLRALSL